MINFKLDGKIYKLPVKWEDVTTKQFQELKKCNKNDDIKILSILLGVEYSILFNTRQNDVDEKITPFLKFINRPFVGKDMPPVSSIKIGEKEYPVPTDLRELSFGQKIDAKNRMNESIDTDKDVYTCIADIVAIYLQPIVDPVPVEERQYKSDVYGYDIKRAEKFAREVIDNCSILSTYAIATFFLNKLLQYKAARTLPYPLNLIRNKYLRGYLNWVYFKKSERSTLSLGGIS